MRLEPSTGLYAAVAAGGIAGGVLRLLVLAAWPAAPGSLPVALLAVNAGGSGLIGLVLAFSEPGRRRQLPATLAVALMAGFCGALTTFSAFAVDSLDLAENPARAVWYMVVSLALWLAAAALGLLVGRWFNAPADSAHLNQ